MSTGECSAPTHPQQGKASTGPAAALAGACPHRPGQNPDRVAPDDELVLPLNKRVVVQYASGPEGGRELHLFCGPMEVIFEEPELFAFGEALARQQSFQARACLDWGDGYQWERVSGLLDALVADGILRRGADLALRPGELPERGDLPSPLPPAPAARARSWDECESITRELAGRPLEAGFLELVVPVFRVAHMALDREGRQVGEANVFPRALRVGVPTRWRTCIYDGTRYLDAKPMNVSALKAMRSHWSQAMAALLRIREAYLERYPAARDGMTLGDVERLSTLALAVATYPLVKKEGRVANGDLHPVLSSMFRMTDGLRMTAHQMLFLPTLEPTRLPSTRISAQEIHAYAERNYSFHSAQGVCAGPPAMIEEFLGVLLEGAAREQFAGVAFDEAVEQALAEIEPAFDYGLLGLQAFATVFSVWPLMTRTYARLADIFERWPGARTRLVARLDKALRAKAQILRNNTYHGTEEWRTNRERVYADIYAQCALGLGDPPRPGLADRVGGRLLEGHLAASDALRTALQRLCMPAAQSERGGVQLLHECLLDCFVRTQEILKLASEVQQRINALLQRPQPETPFSAADADMHVLLQGDEGRRLPNLLDELERLLGFHVHITPDRLEVSNALLA